MLLGSAMLGMAAHKNLPLQVQPISFCLKGQNKRHRRKLFVGVSLTTTLNFRGPKIY
jgi:hypothetical protein